MKFQDATRLLPKFKTLEGRYSSFYDSNISEVFVTYMDGNLAEAQYLDYKGKDGGSRLPLMNSDQYEYTIAALLDNGDLVSVKSLVMQDDIPALMQNAEQLDFMQYNGGDFNADKSDG